MAWRVTRGLHGRHSVISSMDEIHREAARVFHEVQRTASEYNVRGDLDAGAAIASFLRVANVMASHGSV